MKFRLTPAKIIVAAIVGVVVWLLVDLYGPRHHNLRQFDSTDMSSLETEMWRAYYDKNSLRLFRLLVEQLHDHQGFPYLRANYQAYLAARAAMVFKKGKQRSDYELALPYLTKYYRGMKRMGRLSCDPSQVAQLELEWWIVHRERQTYGEPALVLAIADATGALYTETPDSLAEYAQARADAMILRDDQAAGDGVDEQEWQHINATLLRSYQALAEALN